MVNGVVRIIVARGGDFIAFVRAEHGNARIVERLIKRFVFIVEHQRGKKPEHDKCHGTEQNRENQADRLRFQTGNADSECMPQRQFRADKARFFRIVFLFRNFLFVGVFKIFFSAFFRDMAHFFEIGNLFFAACKHGVFMVRQK